MVGQANGHAASISTAADMVRVFPEALQSLQHADPEMYGIIEEEKVRQW